jgi:DMSO/TMAO reductase YedYZ heme-binding membrane subunit
MIKLFIDFIQFLNTLAPLLMALGVLTLATILLSKSIKRHATIYYIVFAIPFLLVAVPLIGRWCGIEMPGFNRIPFLGGILRDYIHAGTLGVPLLIIVMYMGALSPKNPYVKKLLNIRKELSILSGFPILTHSLIRVTNNFPRALNFFFDSEAQARATNTLGAGISNFSFVLGVVMLALFIPLWVTSFDSVHRRMGNIRWKKLQRWSYVLYAMLFIHAMGIQVGGMLNPRGGGRRAPSPAVETTAITSAATRNLFAENLGMQQRAERGERGGRGNRNAALPADSSKRSGMARGERRGEHGNRNAAQPADSSKRSGTVRGERRGERGNRNAAQPSGNDSQELHEHAERGRHGNNNAVQQSAGNRTEAATPSERGGHQQSAGFADIKVGSKTKRYVHIASLLLVFGSYLYLRTAKAKRDAGK